MSISLKKGQKVSLTKDNPNLVRIIVALGWDTNEYDGGYEFDLDASLFLLNNKNKIRKYKDGHGMWQDDIVFYNRLIGGDKSVIHSGDNLTGAGEGDDEVITVDLTKIPTDVDKISFTVTIHDAKERNQNFGQVSNAYIRVIDESNNKELLKYDLTEEYSVETAMVVGELYRYNTEWKFTAVGSGYQGGLEALCRSYGVDVE